MSKLPIISFARTTAALVAGEKTVTRRAWSEAYAARMIRALEAAKARGEAGLLVAAWSKSPRFKGQKVATILVTSITREPTRLIPDSDWEAEGFAFMSKHGLMVGPDLDTAELWRQWRADPEWENYVIRFALSSLEPDITAELFLGDPAKEAVNG